MNSIKKLPQTIIYAARINDRDVLRSSSSGGLFTVPMSVLLLVSGMFVLSCVSFYSKNTILQIVIFFVIAVVCVIANRSILMEAVRLILGKLNRLMESR